MTNLGFAGATYMQDMNNTICSSVASNTEGRLIDRRDGKVYWIAKLKDGNCWMTQNLDLDLYNAAETTSILLTPDDSDISKDWYYSGGPSTIWSSTDNNIIAFYNPGYSVFANGQTPSYANQNLAYGIAEGGLTSTDAHYLQGNYYSFNAATAGTGQSYTTANQNAPSSICPKGWRLPISNTTSTDKSFGKLLNGLNTATIMAAPYYYIYGGYVYNSSLFSAGSEGRYWSSTASSASDAYSLSFNSSSVTPSYYNGRYFGNSVRCVAR